MRRPATIAAADGNVLTLRDALSEGTLRQLAELDAKPAASAEDRWQRRVEFLFERLAVRWEIAGLPLEGQKELLGRYRMASSEERRAVREALTAHCERARPRRRGLAQRGPAARPRRRRRDELADSSDREALAHAGAAASSGGACRTARV